MNRPDPIETAVAEGARRALTKRASALREEAARYASTTTDHAGRIVPTMEPEGRVKARIADDLDAAADAIKADLSATSGMSSQNDTPRQT